MSDQEVLNYLLAYNNMKIIQRKDMFNFSLDTVLLANFCTITKDVKQIIDFGTNNAAIPLLLSQRTNRPITGIEIQKEAVDLAIKNIELNNLETQINIVHADIAEYVKDAKKVGLVICNPPFFKVDDNKGKFAMVHRPDRMIDILNLMQKYDIEPKRIRFVYPKIDRDSHVLLVEGMYKGKKGLKIEPPLYAHNADGSYSNEVRKMFGENIDE